jgi:1L-myo-inositol 1-phosphate cytidylyltransferase
VQAVVLAAGMGTRLRDASPVKPLTPVGGRPLLLRVIDRLAAAGIDEVVIVLGYEAALIEAALATGTACRVTRCFNPDWQAPNGVSLRVAAQHIRGEALLCMADHLVVPALYTAMIDHKLGGAALALGVDRRLGHAWVDEDDVTRVATRGRGPVRAITAIGKNISVYDAYDTGVFKITPALFDALGDVPAPGLSDGVRALAGQGRAVAVDVSRHDWIDIDDPRALALAEGWIAEGV